MNNSEEDGLSDIVDTPEAALVMKPNKPYSSSSNNSADEIIVNSNNNLNNYKKSPKKLIKRNNLHNKRPILDKNNPSSLQRYYQTRKYQHKLFHNPENFAINHHITENTLISLEDFDSQNLLIVTWYLPIKLKLLVNDKKRDEITWEILIESRDFASNLLDSLLISSKKFLWLGILKTIDPIPLDKQDSLRHLLREKYRCLAIFYDNSDLIKIKYDFFLNYFDFGLNFNLPRNSSKLFNYDEQLYLYYYKSLLRHYASEISLISTFHSNPLIYILDYQLFGLPGIIRTSNESMKMIIFWGLSFINDELFSCMPFGQELLTSLLSCNEIIFNTFQEAKPFFIIVREKTGFDYMSNNGLLYVNYMAKSIAIRLANALLDCELLREVPLPLTGINMPLSLERLWEIYWKEGLEGQELIVSIDDNDRNPALLILKLKLIEALAVQLMNVDNMKKIKFLEIYTSNLLTSPNNSNNFNQIKNLIKDINDKLSYECVFLIIEAEIPESIENALLSHTKFLLETQIFESSVYKIQRFLSLSKNTGIVLIPASFESWISSQTNNFMSFHHLSPMDFSNKVLYIIQSNAIDSISKKEGNTFNITNPVSWLEESFDDMIICNKTVNESISPQKNPMNEPMRLPGKRISLSNLVKSAIDRSNKLIIFGFEEVLIAKDAFTYIKDDFDQTVRKILKKPSDTLLEFLQKLSLNNTCTIYVVTGRGLDLLGYWFIELENLGFANEYGFLHKDPGTKVWHRLFEMDWNWKDIVKKIMENYAVKTPGSVLEIKEACVIWKYEHADYELGLKQSDALILHLNEVFENNSEIDVIRVDRSVEVRPMGLNKGTLTQILMEKCYKEKGPIDMIVTVGGMLSDEDMFNGVLQAMKNNKEYFV